MRPIAHTDRHDAPRLIGQFVPSLAAMFENGVVGFEHPVRQPVVAHELPDVFNRVQFRTFGRQRHDGDVWWHHEVMRQMPSRLVDEQHGMGAGRDSGRDLCQMQAHRLRVAVRQHEGRTFAFAWTDRAKDIGRGRALILRGRRPGSLSGPAARDLVLLPNSGFVSEPDLYRVGCNALRTGNFRQSRGELFLKSSIAPAT